jgi:hypothetical protein
VSRSRLENDIVSETLDQQDEVDWKAIVELLREGKTAEIPCVKERDYVRRTTQVVKRAEKKGIAVEVLRGEGVLRIEPRPDAEGNVTARSAESGADFQGERQQERQERREAVRAERAAEGSREG